MANIAPPNNANFCTIKGSIYALVADTTLDPDFLPDFTALQGTGIIQANLPATPNDILRNTDPTQLAIYLPAPIPVLIVDGQLCDRNGAPMVTVLATSPFINPQFFNYSIVFTVAMPDQATPRTYGPYNFDVTGGAVLDLAQIIPVTPSTGEAMVQGPPGLNAYQIAVANGYVGTQTQWIASLKGAKGDSTDKTLQYTINNASGVLDLSPYANSSTVIVNMTGNITSVVMPTPAANSDSFTVTLILKQPAAGNLTVALPNAPTIYPDGLKPPIGNGSNERTRLQMLWADNLFEIMLGSRNAKVAA